MDKLIVQMLSLYKIGFISYDYLLMLVGFPHIVTVQFLAVNTGYNFFGF